MNMKKLEEEYIKNLEQELDNIEQEMLSELNALDCNDCSADQIKLDANTQVVLALQRATERSVSKEIISELAYRYEW